MPVSSSTEHWIKPDALTINLNHFGDPDYLQVSVLAGAVVMAFKQDVIGYNAAHNYRTWPLEAANTYLETSSAVNVYAKLTRSEVNARALVVYDTVLRDIEGREITYAEDGSEILGDPSPDLYYIFLGRISASVSSDGEKIGRYWLVNPLFGSLDSNQQINERYEGFEKMFVPHFDNPNDPSELTWIEAKSYLGIRGGVTMFIKDEKFNIPTIWEGIPIDNDTIYWENGVIKAKGEGFLTGITSQMVVDALGYTPLREHQTIYALTIQKNGADVDTYTPNSAKKTINILVPVKVSELENDSKFATTKDLDDRVSALVNGAPEALDTLKEIADVLEGNVDSIGDIITTLGNKANKATTLDGYGITDAFKLVSNDAGSTANTTVQGGFLSNIGSYLTVTQSNYGGELQFEAGGAIYYRGYSAGVWGNIRTILTSSNYNSYSPSLTGYGASGVWDISISGNSSTATKLANSRVIWGQPFDGTKDINGVLYTPNGSEGIAILDSYIVIGGGTAKNGKPTYIDGNDIYFRYGTSMSMGMTVSSSGNVGIGTDSPISKLHVNGDVYSSGNISLSSILTIDGIELKKSNDDVLYIDGNLVVRGGITMYGTNSTTSPTIWEGIPIDNDTIYWDNGVLKSKVAEGGITSITKDMVIEALGYTPYNSTNPNGYATQTWVNQQGFLTEHQDLSGYQPKITSSAKLAASLVSGLATVATSGSYNDLSNKPTIPTNTNQLTNGAGFITSSALSSYLPLSGGTLSNSSFGGALTIHRSQSGNNSVIKFTNIDGDLGYIGVGGANGAYPNQPIFTTGGFDYGIIHSGNIGSQSVSYATSASSATKLQTTRKLWGQPFDGTKDINGVLYAPNGSEGIAILNSYIVIGGGTAKNGKPTYIDGNNIYFRYGTSMSMGMTVSSSGNVGIGTDSPTSKLHVNGDVLSTGGITQYSDIRKKTKLQDVELTLKQVANAPLIEHYYNSDDKKTTHVGSIAQYWADMNDWFCKLDSDGFYTMEIQNAALASAISVARELERYESKTDKKIRMLKKRINELEDEIEKLKSA